MTPAGLHMVVTTVLYPIFMVIILRKQVSSFCAMYVLILLIVFVLKRFSLPLHRFVDWFFTTCAPAATVTFSLYAFCFISCCLYTYFLLCFLPPLLPSVSGYKGVALVCLVPETSKKFTYAHRENKARKSLFVCLYVED